jgi:hypothetical protein
MQGHLRSCMGSILHKVIVEAWVTMKVGRRQVHNSRCRIKCRRRQRQVVGRNQGAIAWMKYLSAIFNRRRKRDYISIRATHI